MTSDVQLLRPAFRGDPARKAEARGSTYTRIRLSRSTPPRDKRRRLFCFFHQFPSLPRVYTVSFWRQTARVIFVRFVSSSWPTTGKGVRRWCAAKLDYIFSSESGLEETKFLCELFHFLITYPRRPRRRRAAIVYREFGLNSFRSRPLFRYTSNTKAVCIWTWGVILLRNRSDRRISGPGENRANRRFRT